jgi:pyruvate-formate lyase-activating enzyme
MEWSKSNQYNSFNSNKGLTYYENYKKILTWMKRESSDLPPPVECNLDPYAECNNNCYFCIGQRYLRNNRAEVGEMRKLPTPYMLKLVAFLAQWGVRGLCISGGGEPSLHSEIDAVLLKANYLGMDTSFVTNSVKISDRLAYALMETRWVALSVNAGDDESYRKVIGRDHFKQVLLNIEKLATLRSQGGYKTDLCYKFLILPENVHTMVKACKIAKELGVQDFHVRPVDFERSDIDGHKPLELDRDYIEYQFALCHAEETDDFHVYTVTHKFDGGFHVKHDFEQCLATPLVIPILTDGNAYICVDKKMEKRFKIGSAYPNPESILEWWGSENHRKLIESVNTGECSRCTWSQYNKQMTEVVSDDRMCLSFP